MATFKIQMAKKEFSLHSKMSISATYFLSQIYVTKINILHRNLHICKNFFCKSGTPSLIFKQSRSEKLNSHPVY